MSYASYHAQDWAEGKTDEEIRAEIARLYDPIDHPWDSVGNAHLDEVRMRTLMGILEARGVTKVTT